MSESESPWQPAAALDEPPLPFSRHQAHGAVGTRTERRSSRVTLQAVTRENWRTALALAVRPEQQHFVADVTPPVAIALAKAYICPDQRVIEPLAIYRGSTMIGFLQLSYRADSADDYWIFHFFVDQLHQGQGYGRQALAALRDQLVAHHPNCRGLRLTVHPRNTAAQRLYHSFGFRKTGEVVDGEPVYRLQLE